MPRCWRSATTFRRKIDAWHEARAGKPIDQPEYQAFLREIGYLVDEPAPFAVAPTNVDAEVASLAGAQLGGADPKRALPAERGERAVGEPVRCALRHRRDPGRGVRQGL